MPEFCTSGSHWQLIDEALTVYDDDSERVDRWD